MPSVRDFYQDNHFRFDKVSLPSEIHNEVDIENHILSAKNALERIVGDATTEPSPLSDHSITLTEPDSFVGFAHILSQSLLYAKQSTLNDAEKLLHFAKCTDVNTPRPQEKELFSSFEKELEDIVTEKKEANTADIEFAVRLKQFSQHLEFVRKKDLQQVSNASPWSQNTLGTPGYLLDEKRSTVQMLSRLSDDFDEWIQKQALNSPRNWNTMLEQWQAIKEKIDAHHQNVGKITLSTSIMVEVYTLDYQKLKKLMQSASEGPLSWQQIDELVTLADRYAFSDRHPLNGDLANHNHLELVLKQSESYQPQNDPLDPKNKLPAAAESIFNELERLILATIAVDERNKENKVVKKLTEANNEILNEWLSFLEDLPKSFPDSNAVAVSMGKALNELSNINNIMKKESLPWPARMTEAGFKKVKDLGKGATGKVELWQRKVRDPKTKKMTRERVAIKEINNEQEPKVLFHEWVKAQEGERIARIKDSRLLQVLGAFTSQNFAGEGELQAYVMEYVPHAKDLLEVNAKLGLSKDKDATALAFLKGIRTLHDNKMVHGDIKLENALRTKDNKVKIIDPGFSSRLSLLKPFLYKAQGTPEYAAPELYASESYTEKVDVYAAGIALYALYTNEYPYTIKKGDPFTPEKLAKVSFDKIKNKEIVRLIQKMISYYPEDRPAMDYVVYAFQKAIN